MRSLILNLSSKVPVPCIWLDAICQRNLVSESKFLVTAQQDVYLLIHWKVWLILIPEELLKGYSSVFTSKNRTWNVLFYWLSTSIYTKAIWGTKNPHNTLRHALFSLAVDCLKSQVESCVLVHGDQSAPVPQISFCCTRTALVKEWQTLTAPPP